MERSLRRNVNDLQDKQYLALELTKLMFQNANGIPDRSVVYENYKYFLNELTGVLDMSVKVMQLQMEIQTLQKKLAERMENSDTSIKLHRLIDVINQCKGDMEPYVYECLMKEITNKIQ